MSLNIGEKYLDTVRSDILNNVIPISRPCDCYEKQNPIAVMCHSSVVPKYIVKCYEHDQPMKLSDAVCITCCKDFHELDLNLLYPFSFDLAQSFMDFYLCFCSMECCHTFTRQVLGYDPNVKICFTCARPANHMKRCKGCRTATYCNTKCQEKGWENHKRICKKT